MPVPLKYAVVERERRFLLARLPDGIVATKELVDTYVTGTRLRLREVREADGTVVRKLAHKVRLHRGPEEVACTNFYLDDAEWALLCGLPGQVLRKRRHIVERDGLTVAIDEHADGTLLAEIDDLDGPARALPDWLDVLEDVSGQERWTGVALAR
jgi:CYTH domain-containing protein